LLLVFISRTCFFKAYENHLFLIWLTNYPEFLLVQASFTFGTNEASVTALKM